MWTAQGIWSWRDRAQSITHRELKAISKLLMGSLGREIQRAKHHDFRLYTANRAVYHITNAFVSCRCPLMRELRKLKLVLEKLGVRMRSEWLPSVAKKFADALSRRFPRGDLRIRRKLRRSVQDGMRVKEDAFLYRPLGEHPVFLRRQAYAEADLIRATVMKLAQTKAPAILIIPDWPRQQWHSAAIHLYRDTNVYPTHPNKFGTGRRS